MDSDNFIFIYTPCPSFQEAKKIGQTLVKEKWVACANIFPPILSIYPWQGEIEEEEEVLLIMKTRRDHFEQVKTQVEKLHSYTVPCIIALPIQLGNEKYFNWLNESTRNP